MSGCVDVDFLQEITLQYCTSAHVKSVYVCLREKERERERGGEIYMHVAVAEFTYMLLMAVGNAV